MLLVSFRDGKGWHEVIDETGNVYERLTVVAFEEVRRDMRRSDQKLNGARAFWRCSCSCGGECIVSGKDLRNGHTRSCGCLRREIAAESARRKFTGKTPWNKKISVATGD